MFRAATQAAAQQEAARAYVKGMNPYEQSAFVVFMKQALLEQRARIWQTPQPKGEVARPTPDDVVDAEFVPYKEPEMAESPAPETGAAPPAPTTYKTTVVVSGVPGFSRGLAIQRWIAAIPGVDETRILGYDVGKLELQITHYRPATLDAALTKLGIEVKDFHPGDAEIHGVYHTTGAKEAPTTMTAPAGPQPPRRDLYPPMPPRASESLGVSDPHGSGEEAAVPPFLRGRADPPLPPEPPTPGPVVFEPFVAPSDEARFGDATEAVETANAAAEQAEAHARGLEQQFEAAEAAVAAAEKRVDDAQNRSLQMEGKLASAQADADRWEIAVIAWEAHLARQQAAIDAANARQQAADESIAGLKAKAAAMQRPTQPAPSRREPPAPPAATGPDDLTQRVRVVGRPAETPAPGATGGIRKRWG